jgi:Flp pilus assembly protein TadD
VIEKPFEFRVALATFDVSRLPERARDKTTDAFKAAVATYFEEQLGGAGRVGVRFEADAIHVKWIPAAGAANLVGYAVELLQRGDYAAAVPLLESLLATDPDDTVALYNLGMAYSDKGRLVEAKEHLERLARLEPGNANAIVALGVAQARSGDRETAEETLRRGLALEEANGYAHRNLAALIANRGELGEAETHLRRAVELLPRDQQSIAGLAQCLKQSGKTEEADALYERGIALAPDSELAENMRTARGEIAQATFRSRGHGFRPDAMAYCMAALDTFDAMTAEAVRTCAMEIAILGRQGFDVNDPAKKQTLRTLPGRDYSPLQLVSMLYVAFKRIDASKDIGFDLSAEYDAALALRGDRRS